jgi:hypothetical protein
MVCTGTTLPFLSLCVYTFRDSFDRYCTNAILLIWNWYQEDTFHCQQISCKIWSFHSGEDLYVVFKVMTQLFCPEDGRSFSKALVIMHHTIQICDKLMSCGWMWLTACPTHLSFHIVQSQSAVLSVAGKMLRNAKFWVKMLQLMENNVMYCGCSGWRITHNKDAIKGCHYATH